MCSIERASRCVVGFGSFSARLSAASVTGSLLGEVASKRSALTTGERSALSSTGDSPFNGVLRTDQLDTLTEASSAL